MREIDSLDRFDEHTKSYLSYLSLTPTKLMQQKQQV